MADNSDNDKQNEIQSTDKESKATAHEKQELDNTEDVKDIEEDSQDVKSSDMANPIPSPESESEKRCTSASNAGESEYESADDEAVQRLESFEDTSPEHQKVSANDENCAQNDQDHQKLSTQTNEHKESGFEENICDSDTNEKLISEEESVDSKKISQNEIPSEGNPTNDSEYSTEKDCVENIEIIEKEIKESDDKIDENVQRLEIDESNGLPEEVNENDQLRDEEGGHEQIADMDDEYEDIDESEECSLNSLDNEDMADRENEEIDAEERQQGDGEESNDSHSNQKDKSLDHDEDKRNPQYIPKKGPFYEHDDRAMAAMEGEVTEAIVVEKAEETPPKEVVIAKKSIETETTQKKIKKKIWVEGDKWGHDLFREEDQTPKSRDELVNIYGYDIRNEDNPPKARRKRRYARGAIKYTRQWQDENAYGKGRSSPPPERMERKERKEYGDRNERLVPRIDSNDRIPKERSSSERLSIESKHREERKEFYKRDSHERRDSYDRKDKPDRKERSEVGERRDKHRIHERSERSHRSEKSIEFSHKKERVRNERPLNENRKYDYEESVDRRDKPFSNDDFPELPINDLRTKLNSTQSGGQPEVWKPSHRFSGESDDQTANEYKTEPMKIIEAIEHNNRAVGHSDANSPNVVRTLTFENSKYSQRKSNYDFDDERSSTARIRSRKSADAAENSGRPIRKTNNNLNYQNFSHERKESNDNYRNNRNNVRTERSDRTFISEESNRNVERYYEDDYRNQRDRESNYIIDANVGLQKLTIEDKSQVINRTADSEQTRPKRYSSLRQQQQRVIPENMANIATNTQISQTSDNHNINAHQFYDSHTIQTTAFYSETSSPRTTYHTYISPTATDAGPQSHTSTFMQQPIPQPLQQRYIPQPNPPTGAGDAPRYMPTVVPPNVVTASVPSPQMAQSIPQTGPVPPPPQPVISAPPPGTTYIPSVSFPSGYPQFPPAPPPTHVPPGYPGHVTAQQQPSPHQLAELYRGGVTYYDPQSQQQNTVRQIPQRRPKAAIPIVPPPDPHSSEGDGDKSYVSVNS